jgi:hypothetical protein
MGKLYLIEVTTVYRDNVSLVMFCITARKELSFPSVSSNVILENLKDVYRDNVEELVYYHDYKSDFSSITSETLSRYTSLRFSRITLLLTKGKDNSFLTVIQNITSETLS